MKLLILLVALLVRTNPSLSKPTIPTKPNLPMIFHSVCVNLHRIQQRLGGLKPSELKQDLTVFNQTVIFQTPRNIKNACECEAQFFKQLEEALKLVDIVLPCDQIDNIFDLLENVPKDPTGNCSFTTHRMRDASLTNFTRDNIQFIENWNTKCKTKN